MGRPPRQILSLSGGGYRGLYTAAVLEALEARAGAPLGEVFDVIAGTSIGGILAIGLAIGLPARVLREAFERSGKKIFPDHYALGDRVKVPRLGAGLLWSRYGPEGLRSTVASLLSRAPEKATLGDIGPTQLLVTAVDRTNNAYKIFQNGAGDQSISLLDIALATSAAPGLFPEHRIGQSVFLDGGLIANAPDMVAVAHAIGRGHAPRDLRMVSIGTAGAQGGEVPRAPSRKGLLLSAASLADLAILVQQDLALGLAKECLGPNFFRIDGVPSAEQQHAIGLAQIDRAARDTLSMFANNSIDTIDATAQAQFRAILSRRAARP